MRVRLIVSRLRSNGVRLSSVCLGLALVAAACGGSTPEAETATPAPSSSQSPESGGAGDGADEVGSAADAPAPLDAATIEKRLEVVRSIGGLLALSGSCSLQALQHSKIKGPRDMLYMLVGVFPENAAGPEPLCKVDIFSPTEDPTLQGHVQLAATGKGGKLQSKRTRPEKYRPPTEDEQHRLNAVLAAAEAARTRGFTVPLTIRADAGWLVYLMNYTLDENKLSLGPHYRVVVSDAGATKVEQLNAGELVDLALPGGKRLDAIKLQSDSELPNESHVFMSAMSSTMLVVATANNGSWAIHRGKIERVE